MIRFITTLSLMHILACIWWIIQGIEKETTESYIEEWNDEK